MSGDMVEHGEMEVPIFFPFLRFCSHRADPLPEGALPRQQNVPLELPFSLPDASTFSSLDDKV